MSVAIHGAGGGSVEASTSVWRVPKCSAATAQITADVFLPMKQILLGRTARLRRAHGMPWTRNVGQVLLGEPPVEIRHEARPPSRGFHACVVSTVGVAVAVGLSS